MKVVSIFSAIILLCLVEVSISDISGNTCSSCVGCVQCLARQVIDNVLTVTLGTTQCKSKDTISWFCCRANTCTMSSCPGSMVNGVCNLLTPGEVVVTVSDLTATSIQVQIHDGTFQGSVSSCTSGACCGGGKTGCTGYATGVCTQTISLESCPACTTDAHCHDQFDTVCADTVCNNHVCSPKYLPSTTACRKAEVGDDCDISEFCTGETSDCPVDKRLDDSTVCRQAAGVCDIEERCDGGTKCPADLKTTKTCRSIRGACDIEEKCDGTSVNCPDDVLDSTTVCREKVDVCDTEEKCDGSSVDCPEDKFDSTFVCRPAAGDCDKDDVCDGTSPYCSVNDKLGCNDICFHSFGSCSVAQTCTGSSDICPGENRNAYVYNCDGDIGTCGLSSEEISSSSNSCYFGSLSLGNDCGDTDRNELSFPTCLGGCLTCPGTLEQYVVAKCTDEGWDKSVIDQSEYSSLYCPG